MNNQFIFFCVNIGNEKLLKAEIKYFYPELVISFSSKGFLTYKNNGIKYNTRTISQLQVTFATRCGICLGKSSANELYPTVLEKFRALGEELSTCIIHNFAINTDYLYVPATEFTNPINSYSAEGKLVLDLISLKANEIWIGVHRVGRGITRYPNSHTLVDSIPESPSIGNIKLAQVARLYALKLSSKNLWLDFGCCPGGSSSYLLSIGAKVWGVDTAFPAGSILANENFSFIKSSIQNLSQEQLPNLAIDWVHVDVNINPKQAIKEVLRLCKKYNHSLKGIIFTIQIIKTDYIQYIESFEDIFYEWGLDTMISRQVPSHKNEYALIATRNK